MREQVVIDRSELDRLVLMRMDFDRYEAQLIPDLQREVLALRNALRRLVETVQEAEQLISLGPAIERDRPPRVRVGGGSLLNLEATTSHRSALRNAQQLLGERSSLPRTQTWSQSSD